MDPRSVKLLIEFAYTIRITKENVQSFLLPVAPGYEMFRRDRKNGSLGGGVLIAVKDTLLATRESV